MGRTSNVVCVVRSYPFMERFFFISYCCRIDGVRNSIGSHVGFRVTWEWCGDGKRWEGMR